MGWKDWIPNEVKEVFKPVAKAAKKFIPREARPFIPMLTPFLPAMGIMGQLGGPMGFAKMYGANLLSQQLADPDAEFDDLNQFAAMLAGTQGGLTNTGTAENLRGMTTQGKLSADPSLMTKEGIMKQMANAPVGSSTLADAANRSMLTKAKDLGLTGLAEASDYLTGTTKTLQDLGAGRGPVDLFSIEGAKALGKEGAVPFSTGMGGVTEAYQRPTIRQFEKDKAAEEAEIEATSTADKQERADLTMRYYREAGHDEETIQTALETNNLGEFYEPPAEEEAAANGGRIGYADAGSVRKDPYDVAETIGGEYQDRGIFNFWPFSLGSDWRAEDAGAEMVEEMQDYKYGKSFPGETIGRIFENEGFQVKPKPDRPPMSMEDMIESLEAQWDEEGPSSYFEDMGVWDKKDIRRRIELGWDQAKGPTTNTGIMTAAQGGIIGLKHGGMLNFGGREMDLRTGGFVPIGRKERADDVPARLSKNEFVMTADAVRAAGGGSVNKGAQRMYDVMNKLEARA